jgi:hypothetical protein
VREFSTSSTAIGVQKVAREHVAAHSRCVPDRKSIMASRSFAQGTASSQASGSPSYPGEIIPEWRAKSG